MTSVTQNKHYDTQTSYILLSAALSHAHYRTTVVDQAASPLGLLGNQIC